MSFQATALLLAWIMIVLLAFALAGVVRQLHMLATGARQWVSGPRQGTRLEIEGLTGGRKKVVLFADSACTSCDRVLPVFAEEAKARRSIEFAAVFRDDADGLNDPHVRVLANRSELFRRLSIPATPFAVALTGQGLVLDAYPSGSPELIRQLVALADQGGGEE
jgi:thiol-disulfide isomerase/thioredoxin